MYHCAQSKADLDILSLVCADSHPRYKSKQIKKRSMPRRDSPIEALLLSAVISGSGAETRHHVGHGAGE